MCVLEIIFKCCIEVVYYLKLFNFYIVIIFIAINILTILICFIFFESQKEQKILLELQRDKLKKENINKIEMINQNNVFHLNRWKHDMKYIFSIISTQIEEKKYDEAKKSLSFYNDVLNNYNLFYDMNNDIINSIFIKRHKDIIKNNIHISISIDQQVIPIREDDFKEIITLLIDNAIKKCSSEHMKEICISSHSASPYFVLTFEFTCLDHSFSLDTHTIEKIIKKYEGDINTIHNNEYYIIKIVILNNE